MFERRLTKRLENTAVFVYEIPYGNTKIMKRYYTITTLTITYAWQVGTSKDKSIKRINNNTGAVQ